MLMRKQAQGPLLGLQTSCRLPARLAYVITQEKPSSEAVKDDMKRAYNCMKGT